MDITTGSGSVFSNGFVFGKFYPLHKGHLGLIRYAKTLCQRLDVLVCGSASELISVDVRGHWLQQELKDDAGINILQFGYDESHLPNTSVADKDVSRAWSEVFKGLLPRADLVVTSEPYGDYVAQCMNITHVSFDPGRFGESISATRVRADLHGSWQFLPPAVQRHFQRTVVISGTESTGKTELARQLARRYGFALVEEVGRKLINDSTSCTMADLYAVAQQHAAAIRLSQSTLTPLVVVDTDVYITQSYAHFLFDRQLELPPDIYLASEADARLYLDASVPYVQDGTRLPEQKRNLLDTSHRTTLQAYHQPYIDIIGCDWDQRSEAAMHAIDPLLNPFAEQPRH